MDNQPNGESEVIVGRNAVIEALKGSVRVDAVFISDGLIEKDGYAVAKIKALAREKSIVVKAVNRQKLDVMAGDVPHQGVAATICCAEYATVEDILEVAAKKGNEPFIIMADGIEDPHNLGAIIRTAEACGADGLILPKRRSAGLSATVFKTSAGAAGELKVARVTNLTACIKELKTKNIWFYAADMDGQRWCDADMKSGGICLVIGSEGDGISRIVKEECDFVISLPMHGKINSLNASVAAGILMYEVTRQRGE